MVPVGSDMIPEIEHDPTAFSAHATTVDCLAPAPLASPGARRHVLAWSRAEQETLI
jgi:hypothetical protein